MGDPLDIGNTIRQNAVNGFNAAKDYMDNRPPQAAPDLGAAASSAMATLGEGVNGIVEDTNFTTATTPPEGAPLRDRSRLLSGGDAVLPAPHRVGEAVGGFFDSAVDLYNNTPFVDTSGNSPRPDNLEATSAKEGLGNFIGGIADSANAEFASINKGYTDRRNGLAPGAQAGASSTTADNIADQTRGTAKPEDAFSPVTDGVGIDIQGKANDARANQSPVSGNSAYDIITSPASQAQASNENYREDTSRDNYYKSIGLNSPDTDPTRLPSQGQAITNPLGGGQLNTRGGVVAADSARSAPGDAPYLGGGNAPLSRSTGRTTGDGSSNPNSPNYQPVGLGGVPIQSRDQWLAQRSAEKGAVRQRRDASNRRDESRRAQEGRAAEFKKMIASVPKNISSGRRAKIIAKMYGDYLGNSVKSEGQDKSLQASNQRNASNEGIAAADNKADATQNAFKNMIERDKQAAAQEAAQRDAVYDQDRLAQYQATINATAARHGVQQQEAEHKVGLAYAKNQREALAAQRAGLKQASDMDVQNVNLPQLGNYQTNLNTVADLSGASPAQMEEFMKQNPQRY